MLVERLTIGNNNRMKLDEENGAFCPLYLHAIELVGRRWTGAILRALTVQGTMRFSDIIAAVPGLSDRLLSERLKQLECEGIVLRTVIPDHPVRIEYDLTEKGRALESVIAAVATWANDWLAKSPEVADDRAEREAIEANVERAE